jgi:hypothetical protein
MSRSGRRTRGDRYPVGSQDPLVLLQTRIRDLEDRLSRIERGSPLGTSSFSSGAVVVTDTPDPDAAQQIARVGEGAWGGAWGVHDPENVIAISRLEDGALVFLVDASRGFIWPPGQFQFRSSNLFVGTTSITYSQVFTATVHLQADSIRSSVVVTCDAGTTGRVRLTTSLGSTTARTVTDTPGGQTVSWVWDLVALGHSLGSDVNVHVEFRKETGGGSVNVYQPPPLACTDHLILGATVTGDQAPL